MIRLNKGYFEIPLSEIIEIDGTLIQAVKSETGRYPCQDCYLYEKNCQGVLCEEDRRLDRTDIYFKVIKEEE